MGLDSVELLMEIENYFGINITNAEAEKISTVQDMVDLVAKYLSCTDNCMELRDRLFEKVVANMKTLGWVTHKVALSDFIAPCITAKNNEDWKALSQALGLSVTKPVIKSATSNKTGNLFKKILSWTPNYEWEALTFDHFIAAIAAENYIDLVERGNIKNQYEIYITIAGITVDKVGADYYEVAPDKSFTNDLGVD